MSHGKWTKANFKKYHAEHLDIYQMFCKFAHRATQRRRYYSAKNIFHRIRWETQIEEGNAEFKIDDGWIAHYSRKFMEEFPQHKGFFSTRVRKGGYFDDEDDTSWLDE